MTRDLRLQRRSEMSLAELAFLTVLFQRAFELNPDK